MKYEQLTDKQKEKAYERWVNGNPVNYEWWNSLIEEYKQTGKERGIHIDHIYFSGFSSQGDGACWVGYFDLPEYLMWEEEQKKGSIFSDHELVVLQTAFAEDCLASKYKINTSGYYSHSYTMRIDDSMFVSSEIVAQEHVVEGPLAGMDAELFEELLGKVTENLEATMLKLCREYADAIYVALGEEHEYLLSEESFQQQTESNEWEFNDEGELNG
jgi:hypothetical protein